CTGTQIDVYRDEGATGTWTAETGWLTDMTNGVLSSIVPIDGVGILASFTSGGSSFVARFKIRGPGLVDASAIIAGGVGNTRWSSGMFSPHIGIEENSFSPVGLFGGTSSTAKLAQSFTPLKDGNLLAVSVTGWPFGS